MIVKNILCSWCTIRMNNHFRMYQIMRLYFKIFETQIINYKCTSLNQAIRRPVLFFGIYELSKQTEGQMSRGSQHHPQPLSTAANTALRENCSGHPHSSCAPIQPFCCWHYQRINPAHGATNVLIPLFKWHFRYF